MALVVIGDGVADLDPGRAADIDCAVDRIDGSGVGIDWRVLVFTAFVSLGTGLVFGLVPAVQSSRVDLNTTIKESSGRAGSGFRQNKARALRRLG